MYFAADILKIYFAFVSLQIETRHKLKLACIFIYHKPTTPVELCPQTLTNRETGYSYDSHINDESDITV